MTSTSLPNNPASAAVARRYVRTNCTLDRMRLTEADLLVTELVANAYQHAPDVEWIELSIDASQINGIRIAVSQPSATPLPKGDLGVGLTLVDRIARSWGHDFDGGRLSIWFVLRRPGTAALSPDLDDEQLLTGMGQDPASFSDELVRRHSDLAASIARRYRGKGIDDEDLEQVSLMALLKAIQRFDPTLGTLRPFAAVTISGELKKLLRDRAWALRVPRSLQEKTLAVTRAAGQMTQELERAPTAQEVAQRLDLAKEEVVEAMIAGQAYRAASIDKASDKSGLTLADRLQEIEPSLLNLEERMAIEEGIAQLPARTRHILHLRFNEDMTQSEIAEIMDISQMHVSRLLSAAMEDLRTHLEVAESPQIGSNTDSPLAQ